MGEYPATAVERAMKEQEVILRAMAKKITWVQGAEIIGVSGRSMRRWRQRYEEQGYAGLFDRRRGRPSPKRVPLRQAEEVLRLQREKYADLHVRPLHEKRKEGHGLGRSYTWVKLARQGAGLVKKGRKRGVHRKRRARRPLPGMLRPWEGSRHQGCQDDRWYELLEVLDDATRATYQAQWVEEESTRTVMAALREVLAQQGRCCARQSDRASPFFVTPAAGGPVHHARWTPVGRALQDLEMAMLPAYSPPAGGRRERRLGPWQGRRPQALRRAGIRRVEAAHHFLRTHDIGPMNRPFSVPAAPTGNAFVPLHGQNWERIFSVPPERTVAQDNPVRLGNRSWQIERTSGRGRLADCRVIICEHREETVSIVSGPQVVGRFTAAGQPLENSKTARGQGGGNDAPRKARKTPRASFPRFPPRLEIRPTAPASHISTAPTAADVHNFRGEKKNQNRTDPLL